MKICTTRYLTFVYLCAVPSQEVIHIDRSLITSFIFHTDGATLSMQTVQDLNDKKEKRYKEWSVRCLPIQQHLLGVPVKRSTARASSLRCSPLGSISDLLPIGVRKPLTSLLITIHLSKWITTKHCCDSLSLII